MPDKVSLQIEDKIFDLPVIVGSENEKAIDIRNLRASSGYITIDSGFGNTGSCQSTITYIDGDLGILRYRGYPIEELCQSCSFEEVIYLLLYNKLPSKSELESFNSEIASYATIDFEAYEHLFKSMPKDAHPMTILSAALTLVAAHNPNELDPNNEKQADILAKKLIAKIATITAASYKNSIGEKPVAPDKNLDYTANFLNMMFAKSGEKYEILPEVYDVMNRLFILHADHEQNCSTSAVRLVGSSQANLVATVVAGVSALSGPSHGGANQAVLEQLAEIAKDGGGAEKFIAKAKDKNDSFRLMGFGHRVYKNYDPRANIIKENADAVLDKLNINDPFLDIAKKLASTALSDEYFQSRKLFPNVDFYSGIIYRAIGFPVEMFTVLFAIGRLPGWIAQWKEMLQTDNRIGRPRQIYTGETTRPVKK